MKPSELASLKEISADQAAFDRLPERLRASIAEAPINFVGFCEYAAKALADGTSTEDALVREFWREMYAEAPSWKLLPEPRWRGRRVRGEPRARRRTG